MKCRNCGFENLDSSHVCRKCGATLFNQENEEVNNSINSSNTTSSILAIVVVILVIVVGLFAVGAFDNHKDPVVTNNPAVPANKTVPTANKTTPIKQNELVYSGNGNGTSFKTFSLNPGTYNIKVKVVPLNNNSYFYLNDYSKELFKFKWNNSNLTAVDSSINITISNSLDFTLYSKDVKSWNIEVYKINK